MKKYQDAVKYIKNIIIDTTPKIGIVLGSGLGLMTEKIEDKIVIPYSSIPNFPISTVDGHDGNLIIGTIGNNSVIAMQGRFHFYEGYSMEEVTFPIRVMKLLGVEYLFVSNAAGGLNPEYKVGDLMIIEDHINFFPGNPLRGKNEDSFGPRFPDMSKTYCPKLINKALEIGRHENIKLKKGIYIGSSGPTLETPAEYKLFRLFGADATGMSTIPEIIVAHHCGISCFGISVITNESAIPFSGSTSTIEEVKTNAAAAEPKLTTILLNLIEQI
ncbi:MAG: purine-nucleoside phosphorylase [Bacteroidales bacterium]|nr:purine-nucleoside phosphorylase [Bacteroidales bacterium]